jgi:hypothetical protein
MCLVTKHEFYQTWTPLLGLTKRARKELIPISGGAKHLSLPRLLSYSIPTFPIRSLPFLSERVVCVPYHTRSLSMEVDNAVCYLDTLPDDVLEHLLSLTSVEARVNLARTSRRYRGAAFSAEPEGMWALQMSVHVACFPS